MTAAGWWATGAALAWLAIVATLLRAVHICARRRPTPPEHR